MKLSLGLLSPLLLALSGPALGNGALASFPAGGVVFQDSADIAIAQEDLILSPGEVRVHYQFFSSADETQSATIGFPLPRVPSAPDEPDAVGAVAGSGGDRRNYLGFGVAVDGRPLIPILHEYAFLGDEDVTAQLLEAGLPLLPDFDTWEAWPRRLDPALVTSLFQAGLISGEPGQYLNPRWDYQVVYEWVQDFAPGDTAVDIRYRPLMGWPNDFGDAYEIGATADSACVNDTLRAKLAAHKAQGDLYDVAQLDYITETAKHWHGPIGRFNLTIDTGTPNSWEGGYRDVLFASCPVAATGLGDGQWGFTATDYVPDRDVRVFFYFFN